MAGTPAMRVGGPIHHYRTIAAGIVAVEVGIIIAVAVVIIVAIGVRVVAPARVTRADKQCGGKMAVAVAVTIPVVVARAIGSSS